MERTKRRLEGKRDEGREREGKGKTNKRRRVVEKRDENGYFKEIKREREELNIEWKPQGTRWPRREEGEKETF